MRSGWLIITRVNSKMPAMDVFVIIKAFNYLLLILAMKKNVLIYGVTKNLIMECVAKSAYTSRNYREGRSKSNQPLESTFTSDRI